MSSCARVGLATGRRPRGRLGAPVDEGQAAGLLAFQNSGELFQSYGDIILQVDTTDNYVKGFIVDRNWVGLRELVDDFIAELESVDLSAEDRATN